MACSPNSTIICIRVIESKPKDGKFMFNNVFILIKGMRRVTIRRHNAK